MMSLDIDIDINDIDDEPTIPPAKSFISSIEAEGIIQPVVLELTSNGRYKIVFGRRRIAAARILGMKTVPALVRQSADFRENDCEYLVLIENNHRAQNPGAELQAVKNLTRKGLSVEDIAKHTRIPLNKMKKIFRLSRLSADAVGMLERGEITENVALQLSRLPKDKQVKIITELDDRKLSAGLVTDAVREHNLSAAQPILGEVMTSLPEMSPLRIEFEKVAGVIAASKNANIEIARAIEVIRNFITEETTVPVSRTPQTQEA